MGELVPGNFRVDLKPDALTFRLKKRLGLLEAERRGKLAVVAEERMDVEREMGAVEREIVAQDLVEHPAAPARDRLESGPEKPVMDDKEIYAAFDGSVDRAR